jgi:hypothetical protein
MEAIGNIVAISPLEKYRGRYHSPDKKTKQVIENVHAGKSECTRK